MKRFLLSRPVGHGIRGLLLMAMLLMSLGYSGTEVAYAAPPTHDDFNSAIEITGIEYHDTENTTEATPIVGQPSDDPGNIPCEGDTLNQGFASVWYKYTPTVTQKLTADTFGSSYDTFIAVWTGTRGALNLVACNDTTFEGLVSEVSFVVNAGTTYFIEIAQYNDGTGGTTFFGGDLVFNAYISNTEVWAKGDLETRYYVPPTDALRRNILNLNTGPLEIFHIANNPLLASERMIYRFKGKPVSYSEMLALPNNQLSTVYWLPWYNNKTLDTQLRIANASGTDAFVHVRIGGKPMPGSPYTLSPGQSIQRSYDGVNKGPVKIISNVKIVAATRVIYKVSGIPTSYSEMMAFPHNKADKVFWLPWYTNNATMNTQLRFVNVSSSTASIRVFIGGKPMPGSPFKLARGASITKTYPGIDRGPVKIVSNVKIVASAHMTRRATNTVPISYAEVMGLPNNQASKIYWLPVYTKNSALDTQLQIANASPSTATVRVYINGTQRILFKLAVGRSRRVSFAGIDQGPVKIVSNVKIVASAGLLYKVSGKPTSYSETMALPHSLLDTRYWIPWYNNKTMNTQLRIAIPSP